MTALKTVLERINRSVRRPTRRTAQRHQCRADLSVRLIVARRYECYWATPLDVSTEGISFLICDPLAAGTAVFLRLQGAPGAAPLTLLAEVTHATPRRDGSWAVGCRFDGIADDLTEA